MILEVLIVDFYINSFCEIIVSILKSFHVTFESKYFNKIVF